MEISQLKQMQKEHERFESRKERQLDKLPKDDSKNTKLKEFGVTLSCLI